MEEAIQSYGVHYLQAFEQIGARTEEARQGIQAMRDSPVYRTLSRLGSLGQLGGDPIPGVERIASEFEEYLKKALETSEEELSVIEL